VVGLMSYTQMGWMLRASQNGYLVRGILFHTYGQVLTARWPLVCSASVRSLAGCDCARVFTCRHTCTSCESRFFCFYVSYHCYRYWVHGVTLLMEQC
jgi:hypothetical protein